VFFLRDHDMQWDFWTLSPESAHQVTWLFGDRGIPQSWRHMNLYSGHTFMWVNAAGEKVWVRYHFTQAEADALVSIDTDYHTRDLFEAIKRGDYPSWTLKMQIMPFDDAKTYRFNPFDLTKVPHADYPLIEVGRLTLDRNPTDQHSQIEQGAWEPSNLVPGIAASPDKMLPGRMSAYADAHRYRIGANDNQPPVNAPKSPVHSDSTAGHMRYQLATDPVYAPNSKGGPQADTERYGQPAGWHTDGDMVRSAYTLRADDDWGRAGTLVRQVMNDAERDRLVDNVVGHLLNGVSEPALERAFDYWRNIDRDLGDRIEKGVRQ
jgi:catalase